MKIYHAYVSTESAEVDAEQSFIDAYQSTGAVWSGTITPEESVAYTEFTLDWVKDKIALGYEMVLYNSRVQLTTGTLEALEYARANGLLFVIPVGNNSHINITDWVNQQYAVLCGSGIAAHGNATAYPCTFYDASTVVSSAIGVSEAQGIEIVDIRQTGTSYTVTEILRVSSSRLRVKLSGITTLAEMNAIGLVMYQNASEEGGLNYHSDVPVYFSSIVGSDILNLPDGVKYVSDVGAGWFEVLHTSTSGTIGGSYQAVTGSMKFGYTDATRVMIQLKDYIVANTSSGITIDGVTGFQNTPDGLRTVVNNISNLGYGDKITITFNLGTGSATANGRFYFVTQSYSTPTVGGKLALIKDTNLCTWDESISRGVNGSAAAGVFDSNDGYGIINISSAIAIEDLYLDTPVITVTETSEGTVTVAWSFIPFATDIDIYFRGEYHSTVTAGALNTSITIARQSKCRRNYFKAKAKNATKESEFSNLVEYDYYYVEGILFYASPIITLPPQGYGYNYGQHYGQ